MTIRVSRRSLLVAAVAVGAGLALLLLVTGPAQGSPTRTAQMPKPRTFVSTKGVDTNTCGPADPCRTISRALVETSAGGEVVVLDSGGYGPFTIDKSVTVTAVGVYAGVTASSGTAINVNAGPAARVILRGLTLNGFGGGIGLAASSVGQLYVDELKVRNFTGAGISLALSASASVFVSDTTVSGSGNGGLFMQTTGGTLEASVSNSRFERNAQTGLLAGAGTQVTVRDSLSTDNDFGFSADGGTLNLERSVVANNTDLGLISCNGGTLRASETMVTGNGTGVVACPTGTAISFGNNRVHGNTNNGGFSSTVPET